METNDRSAGYDLFLVVLGCALMAAGLAVILNVGTAGILFVAAGLAIIGVAVRRSQRRG